MRVRAIAYISERRTYDELKLKISLTPFSTPEKSKELMSSISIQMKELDNKFEQLVI